MREKDVAKEKREEPEKIETEEPSPFEAGEVPEEAEEEPEEEPTEDELAEEEIVPVEDVGQMKWWKRMRKKKTRMK